MSLKPAKNLLFVLIPVLIGLSACRKDSYYHQFRPVGSWSRDQVLNFEDSLCFLADKDSFIELSVYVRNNNSYPYSNLSLYVDIYLTDTSYHDNIHFELTNERGKWTGSGWGSLFTHHKHLRIIPAEKMFSIDIRHAMQDEVLRGIQNVGICLSKPD